LPWAFGSAHRLDEEIILVAFPRVGFGGFADIHRTLHISLC
jgi:hypothetical protein